MRLFRHYFSRPLITLMMAECCHLFFSIYLGQMLYVMQGRINAAPSFHEMIWSGLIFMVVMCVIMIAMGLYERNFWNGRSDMLLRITVSFLLGLFVITTIYYLFPDLYISRGAFTLVFGIAFIGVLLLRFISFHTLDRDQLRRRVLVLGVGRQAAQLEALQGKNLGFQILGYIQVHEQEQLGIANSRMLQVISTLSDLVEALRVGEIVIAIDDRRKGFPLDEVFECKRQGISISNFLAFYERETGRIQLDALRPSNLIFSDGFQLALLNQTFKRLLDIFASSMLLVVVAPFMLLTALAIWLESGYQGPILYRQSRIGLNGNPFEIVKFRSMSIDAEKDGKAVWAPKNDHRVTRVGRIIRETRIDELPQLYNVLRGDMSFVGPRPERPQFVAELAKKIPFYSLRHMVKPGITGWAQICFPYGASEEDARRKLEYDLYYIKNYSLFFDVVILLQTVHTVFWGKGAH